MALYWLNVHYYTLYTARLRLRLRCLMPALKTRE